MKRFLLHMRNNAGDTNVSKMIMVAIVFVVGAILLVMVTSAFRGPIDRWFETVVMDWFDNDGNNGGYSYDNGLEFVGDVLDGDDTGNNGNLGNGDCNDMDDDYWTPVPPEEPTVGGDEGLPD
jgi:hypothetical protein